MYFDSPKKRRKNNNRKKTPKKRTPTLSLRDRIRIIQMNRKNRLLEEERNRELHPFVDHNGNIVLLHPNEPPPDLPVLMRQ